ncbi:hypothetical protein FSP39_004826 [Pinctada imbricata]|uniref:Tetraspanin n=1 Tax=Pinctada imbricata TaxID=66713 RepID=A0AA88YBG0_PINIB|nr:hypothetical protein FSP39_004826 [Pinctada imbricata]
MSDNVKFSIPLQILGCGGLVVGVWMEINKEPYGVVLPSHAYLKATSLLISASVITLIIGFVGCCGSLIENRGMLVVYFVFLLVTFILGVVATALAFTNKEVFKKSLKTELLYSLEYSTKPNISDSSRDGVNNMLNMMQTQLNCCGVNNYTDWYRVGDHLKHVPESCCVHRMKDCGTSQSYEWYKRVGTIIQLTCTFIYHIHSTIIILLFTKKY